MSGTAAAMNNTMAKWMIRIASAATEYPLFRGAGRSWPAKMDQLGEKGQPGDFEGISGLGVRCDRRATGFICGRFSAETLQILVKSQGMGSSALSDLSRRLGGRGLSRDTSPRANSSRFQVPPRTHQDGKQIVVSRCFHLPASIH